MRRRLILIAGFFIASQVFFGPAQTHAARSGVIIQTHIQVPSLVTAFVGQVEEFTVVVTGINSGQTPTGYVALWSSDIPKAINVTQHTVGLDGSGDATFHLKQPLPGIAFTAPAVSIYYVPTPGSSFAASQSRLFSISMQKWPATIDDVPSPVNGDGTTVPIPVTISSAYSAKPPVGGLTVTDESHGGSCTATFPSAILYSSDGDVTINADMPSGVNEISVDYLGDTYYAATSAPTQPVTIVSGGRTDGVCPPNWASLADEPLVGQGSGADMPLINYGFPPPYGTHSNTALNNANVGTYVVQLDWSDAEPTSGVYDFSQADAEANQAIEAGKKVALVLRFQSGFVLSGSSKACAWNFGHAQLIPKWAANQLGSANSFCSHGTALTIPNYWSNGFLQLWTAFVDQVAAHFSDIGWDIAYVRGPVGLSDEATPITGPNFKPVTSDWNHLLAFGFDPQKWEAWQEDMLTFYKQAFSYAPWILYSVNKQVVNNKCDDSMPNFATGPDIPAFDPRAISCSSRPVEVDVAEWAVDNGFGLSQNSLDPSWVWRNPEQDSPSAGDINTILAYAAGHTPRPLVTAETFGADTYYCDLAVRTGLPKCSTNHSAVLNAEQDISYAHSHGVSEIEWYQDDLVNPQLQPVISLWRQLQAFPGDGTIPTLVTVTPAQSSASGGSQLAVTVSVRVPGTTGFFPGGTVTLFDDITDKVFKTMRFDIGTGSKTVDITVPHVKAGHLNLSATFVDAVKLGGHLTGTWLWKPDQADVVRVTVQ